MLAELWESAWVASFRGCSIRLLGGVAMKLRIVFLVLSLVLIVLTRSSAQQTPDQQQANLVAYAHFKALTMAERNQLLAEAQFGRSRPMVPEIRGTGICTRRTCIRIYVQARQSLCSGEVGATRSGAR